MPANDVDLSEKVKDVLDAATLSMAFTPERVYVPDWDLRKDLGTLQVCTFPDARTAERRDRSSMKKTARVGVALAKRLQDRTLAEIDDLLALGQEISDLLELQPVTTDGGKVFSCISWEDRIRFDPSQLQRDTPASGDAVYSGVFLAVTVFNYLLIE